MIKSCFYARETFKSNRMGWRESARERAVKTGRKGKERWRGWLTLTEKRGVDIQRRCKMGRSNS